MDQKKYGKHVTLYGALSLVCALLFLGLIAAVLWADVQPIGPNGSTVGLGGMNGAVRDALGVSDFFYELTELLGYVALAVVGGFGIFGLWQWIRQKSLRGVDKDLWCLAALYVVVFGAYGFFELVVINYRPILVEGILEASFPSSHTMLVLCVMGSAMEQCFRRIGRLSLRIPAMAACGVVMALTAVGRLASGVHWLTDILGGVLLSGAFVFAYLAMVRSLICKPNRERGRE